MPKSKINITEDPTEIILAEPKFRESLLETISQIRADKNKWYKYEELVYKKSFLNSVARGIADADSGKTYCTQELKEALTSRRNKE